MTPRNADRLATLLSILLLAMLAIGAYYLSEQARRQDALMQPERGTLHEPDAFAEGFGMTRIDARGQPVYRLEAERMLHYGDDGSLELERMRLTSLDPARPRVTARADRGEADSEGTKATLDGGVVITRAGTDGNADLRIETEHAVILSDTEVARSDRPVRITQGNSMLSGIGMEYDNINRRLRVDARVQARWQPDDETR